MNTGPTPDVNPGLTPQPIRLRTGPDGDPVEPGVSFYDQVGGRPVFEKLVRAFYDGVKHDDLLWPMYPQGDLDGAVHRLTGFLVQYFGGPGTYSEERGHPRLRQRHMPFKVNPAARERWLFHMRAALDSLALSPLHDATMWDYFDRAAHAMVNTFEE